jgi:hypothetical protein
MARKRASPLVRNVEPKMSKKRIEDVQKVHGRRIAGVRVPGDSLPDPTDGRFAVKKFATVTVALGALAAAALGLAGTAAPAPAPPAPTPAPTPFESGVSPLVPADVGAIPIVPFILGDPSLRGPAGGIDLPF